jgi:Txe/YoeB family toxin of toxin-antitoxin system
MYNILLSRQAEKDTALLERVFLKVKAVELLRIIRQNPFQNPPPYEKLKGYENVYSRRINRQHRLIYQIYLEQKIIKVIRMWTHYE